MQIGKNCGDSSFIGGLEDEGDITLSTLLIFFNYISRVLYNKKNRKRVKQIRCYKIWEDINLEGLCYISSKRQKHRNSVFWITQPTEINSYFKENTDLM